MNDLPPWLQVLYPFSQHTFAGKEGQQHYVDEGRGPAIVMLHGNPTWSFLYRGMILSLRDSFRCLAIDHLGCGLSDKPASAEYTLKGHIRRTVDWIRLVDPGPFHLVVHDWGGPIGFGVAAELGDQVKSVSVLNTAAFPFPTIPPRIAVCRIPLLGSLLLRRANAFVEGAVRMTTVREMPEAVKEGYRYPYKDGTASRVAVQAFVKDIPMRKSHPSRATLEAVADSLAGWRERPVQILWGMRDWCFHTGILAEWEKRLPQAVVHRFEDAGHFVLEDAGEAIYPLVAELAGSS